MTKRKYEGMSKAEIAKAQKDKFWGMSEQQIADWKKKKRRKNKERLYIKAETNGELPANIQDNISAIWKALEKIQADGVKLPKECSDIINKRAAISAEINNVKDDK